ncbi:MAG TPA: hypothetical protein VGD75_06885 [Bradyrhizobium sp.]
MRIAILCVFFLSTTCFVVQAADHEAPTTQPNESAALVTPSQEKQVKQVVASMLAAGFPDAHKAEVYSGKVAVKATFDPAKTTPLPSEASTMQMTNGEGKGMTYGYAFDGVHFKLSDGSWIIGLSYHFAPGPADSVDVSGARKINLSTLSADAIAAHPTNAEKDAAKWLAQTAPEQREQAKRTLNRLAPVLNYLRLDLNRLAPAAVLLTSAGWADGPALSLAIADQRARSYWQMRPWTFPDALFDPTGAYPTAKADEAAWQKANPQFKSEAPDVALRRSLFRWCRAQIMLPDREDAMLPLSVAAAASKAAVDPKDPQGNAARIDALAAGAKLPVEPAENADLAARLQSWEGNPRQPKMVVSGGGASIATSFSAPAPAYAPAKTDLDALVALLADERPSRFFDFSGPRTLGDNAWRALAVLLKDDPRTLAGYPVDHPWTPAERRAAAKAVQQWWKQHRSEFVDK